MTYCHKKLKSLDVEDPQLFIIYPVSVKLPAQNI